MHSHSSVEGRSAKWHRASLPRRRVSGSTAGLQHDSCLDHRRGGAAARTAATPRAAPDGRAASATDATERESTCSTTRTPGRSALRRRRRDETKVDYDADLDGKRYSASVKRRANGDLEERFSWDDADVSRRRCPQQTWCDFDGSYSCDRASSLVAGTAPSFTIETGLAVSDERGYGQRCDDATGLSNASRA